MRLDQLGFLVGLGFLLRFAEFLDQTHRLALQAAVESTTGACMHNITKLFGGEVEKSVAKKIVLVSTVVRVSGLSLLVKVDATVGKFAEGSLLFQLCMKRHRQLI